MKPVKFVLLLAFFAFAWTASAVAQESRSISLKSTITHVQPMTGIVLWSDNPAADLHPEAITLEYRYCGYDEVVNAAGQYDYAKLDRILDAIASRNHQAVLRFYFCYVGKKTTVPEFIRARDDYDETVGKSEKKKTHFCDWSNEALQEFTLEFYSKFAARYDTDPRLAFLQTGFGLWAEYHIYDGPRKLGKTFPSKEYQTKFLRHLDEQFTHLPWSISVDAVDSDYSPLEANQELLGLEFGVFDDSFLCKQHAKENAVNWKAMESDRWKRQPGGGEFSYYNHRDQKNALAENGPNGVSFESAARQFHISYMIGNDQVRHSTIQRITAAGLATGYRFSVTTAAINGNDLHLRVSNNGVAPLYRDAWFATGRKRSATSLKGLLPGESLTCVISDVRESDLSALAIQSDAILPTQTIQFEADLR